MVWTAGSTISVQVINDIGMSIGQGVWSGFVALTSFLWGAFGHEFFSVFTAVTMRSRTGAMVGLALLMTGIALLAAVGECLAGWIYEWVCRPQYRTSRAYTQAVQRFLGSRMSRPDAAVVSALSSGTMSAFVPLLLRTPASHCRWPPPATTWPAGADVRRRSIGVPLGSRARNALRENDLF